MSTDNVVGARFGGKVSPTALLTNALNRANAGEIEAVVTVQATSVGDVRVGWSSGVTNSQILGMLEVAKFEVLSMMREAGR